MRKASPFWRLTSAERLLWDAYPTGAWVDLRTGDRALDDPVRGGTWGQERVIRAEVIASLLLGAHKAQPGQVAGVRLAGARVEGPLNLSDATITNKLHLLNCHIPETVALTDASTKGVRFRGCDIYRLRAARSTIDGLFELDGSTVHCGVRLDDAQITGQLRMSHTRLGAPDGPSRGSEIYLQDTRLPLTAAESQARGHDERNWAFWASGLVVRGGAFLNHLHADGGLRLVGARFDGGLYARYAVIDTPGTHAVYADHLQASTIELSAGFTARGMIRLRGARVGGVLSFDGATVSAPDRALHLSHMQTDELILQPKSIEGGVNLGYSRIGVLLDDPAVWPETMQLNGLTYESLRGPARLGDRLSWLRRDPDGYRPQPYEQLAAWYRRIGHDHEARRVLLEKQRARRPMLRPSGRAWGRLLDMMVGYGYRPWLAGVWVGLLLAVGITTFTLIPPMKVGLDEVRHFDAFVYTLDLLAPVSVFEQRGAWEPIGWTQWLANILIASGWILATALIAGATRVLRPSNAP